MEAFEASCDREGEILNIGRTRKIQEFNRKRTSPDLSGSGHSGASGVVWVSSCPDNKTTKRELTELQRKGGEVLNV